MSLLDVKNAVRRFGELVAVRDVSLAVERGELRAIIGPNGAGKTTLFNILSGALRASGGRITLFDRDITPLAPHQRAKMGLARTFQITNVFPRLTVLENVLLALQAADGSGFCVHRRMRDNKPLFTQATALLERWQLGAIAARPAKTISYGEQRLLDLVLAMAMRPKVLLLDEPTAGLSAAEVVRVVGMIRSLPKEITIAMIEHDMDVAFDLADRITVLHQGYVIAEGNVDAIRSNQQVAEIYLGAD